MDSVKKLEKLHESVPIKNINRIHHEQLSRLERLAIFVTERVGTMGFFFIIFTWTILWLGWNIFAPRQLRFDPFPGFVLWLFISNLIQLHLMPLIMIGQNIQGKHQELRSLHDYETDKRAEEEVKLILSQLDTQQKFLEDIIKRLDNLEGKKS